MARGSRREGEINNEVEKEKKKAVNISLKKMVCIEVELK